MRTKKRKVYRDDGGRFARRPAPKPRVKSATKKPSRQGEREPSGRLRPRPTSLIVSKKKLILQKKKKVRPPREVEKEVGKKPARSPVRKSEPKKVVDRRSKKLTLKKPTLKKPTKQLTKKPVATRPESEKRRKPVVKKPEPRRKKKPPRRALPLRGPDGRFAKPEPKPRREPKPKPKTKLKPRARKPGKPKPKAKPPAKRRRPPAKPPTKKKPPVKKPSTLPTVAERSGLAEVEIQGKLVLLQESLARVESSLRMGLATFVNPDGTVDGELRIANLPEDWREPGGGRMMAAVLSSAFREWPGFDKAPVMGGSFWISFTIRFGSMTPDEVEELVKLYKRHRGLFQITTYPLQAWLPGAIQMALVSDVGGLKGMATSLMDKRGYPPAALLVRVVWMTTTDRPGHFKGE